MLLTDYLSFDPLTCPFDELPLEDVEPGDADPTPHPIPPEQRTDTHEDFMVRHRQDEWLHWQLSRTAKHLSTPLKSPFATKKTTPKKRAAKK